MRDLNAFTNSYPVSKTLRFKLIPVGDTLKHIEEKGFLTEDEKRAESYKEMKKTIDEYHKWFIEKAMDKVVLTELPTYYQLYTASFDEKKTDEWKKAFEACKKDLRKEVVAGFSNADVKDIYSKLYKKELFKDLLPEWKESVNPDAYLDESFNKFTTYFTGFHENRRNMYSEEEKSTAISYRLINENLPKHIDNIKVFQSVAKTEIVDSFEEIYSAFEPYLNVAELADVFTLENYNELLTQKQIDAYNLLIGGKSEKGKVKIKGINEYINLYNQQNKDQHLPKLKKLYKQILSDREKLSFLPESFDDLNELTAAVDAFYNENLRNNEGIDVLAEWKVLLAKLPSSDLQHIYFKNDRAITDVSQSIFENYSVIRDAINYYEETFGTASKKKTSSKKGPDYYSLSFLEMVLEQYIHYIDDGQHQEIVDAYSDKCIASSFAGLEIFDQIETAYNKISDIAKVSYAENEKLKKEDKDALKEFLDLVLELQHTVKPLFVDSEEYSDKDLNFYGTFESLYSALDLVIPLYNKVRNYMTKKPYSTEKIKLNFNSPTLLDGWDLNKETSNLSIILRKDGLYYLGIIDKADTKAIEKLSASDAEDCYEKMEYKLLPGPNKMLPKVFFAKSNIDDFQPSDEILAIREKGSFKKGNNFSIEDCHKFIDFYKDSINKHDDWKNFGFEFSDTESYEDISKFYKQVELQGYKMSFKKLAVTDIDQLVSEGKLYLFQIYNKDFSEHSHGKPNLHTMYWKALFDEKNLQDIIYKLNGQAEIFYRKASIKPEDATVHLANQPIAHKPPNDTESLFVYDITKDKRYTVDQFQFHVPITMNFKAAGDTRINQKVREYIKNNPDVNVIGIDRGERNLLYISVIDQKGNVLRDADGKAIQYSLNDIVSRTTQNGKIVETVTPYHELLDKKEKDRAKSRESWDTIEGIKELKEGYISQVVSLITHLMVEYNAIVVMEDLNFGFKRGRFKVEKQVYQKFEKMLIDKLNYLVFKDAAEDSPAGLYNALQLTGRFTSFREMGKQTGFIFYVPAWNTSKMDPVTGFVNLFPRPKTVGEKKAFFSKFENIYFDGENFCFQFDYSDFTQKAKTSRTKWTLSTQGRDRLYWDSKANNGKGEDKEINLTQSIKELLEENGIPYSNGENLTEEIAALSGSELGKMYFYLSVLLKMRYSNKKNDFILSPVADKNGVFYYSDKCADSLPQDADANGAYNIARKGLWVIEQINKSDDVMKAPLAISNEEWLNYIQK